MCLQVSPRSPIAAVIATLAGVGRIAVAPGTLASLLALPLAWLLIRYTGTSGIVLAILAATAIGTWASGAYARETGTADPSECVVDELAGQWLACSLVPLTLGGFVLAFLLFRLFDIVKPWPISAVAPRSGR